MSNKILFVFEGEKSESEIVTSLESCHISGKTVIKCVFGAEVYQIYRQISEDPDLDTFNLLKERSAANKAALTPYTRDDFAEIYLFFDYDGHSPIASDTSLNDLIDFFNEETDKGKLYISYPMVEALKHICDFETFRDLCVECKQKIKYKGVVATDALTRLQAYNKYDKAIWNQLIIAHLKKINFLVHDSYSLPGDLIAQREIFDNQLKKHINPISHVAVASAFPVFLHDYYGNADMMRRLTT